MSEVEMEAVIGLEIHVQLATKTKMFCGCEISFGAEPNSQVCPGCLGLPGALPVTNRQAIEYAIRIGVALGCEIAPVSAFHRKSYFYPDNPKAYQASQLSPAICFNGKLAGVRINRAHAEEDAAKQVHVGGAGRIQGASATLVDFNRSSIPLVEIVTEPDLRSGAQVRDFGRLLQATMRQIGVSDANMEEGSLRCDANVSVRPVGSDQLGTKTELKNMNSFRFIERAVEAEIARQKKVLAEGGTIHQETLHYDTNTGEIHSMRSKEGADDYRYVPEPDLPPLVVTEAEVEAARAALPELPADRMERYRALEIPEDQSILLSFDPDEAGFFDRVLDAGDALEPRVVANWVTGELAAELRNQEAGPVTDSKVEPKALAALIGMVDGRRISHGSAKTVLEQMVAEGADPEAVVKQEGLEQISDSGELEAIVDQAITDNAAAAEQVRSGNEKAIGALVGAVMKATRGRADGGEVTRLLQQKLND